MMSAREAMEEAIRKAQVGMIEGARLWLDIARELRVGAKPAPLTDGPTDGPIGAQEWVSKAMRGDPGGVRYGTTMAGDPAYGRSVETEVMAKLGPDGYPVMDTVVRLPRHPDPEAFLTRVGLIKPERKSDPPIYTSAGETLGDTKSVPQRIAHPQEDAVGPHSICLSAPCGLPVIWIKGRGWVHDTPSHTASCDKAAQEVPGGE